MNAEDKLGTIEEGKYADLVVLNRGYFDRHEVPTSGSRTSSRC
jgi:imidazolonepropionase-like amidohydrolase